MLQRSVIGIHAHAPHDLVLISFATRQHDVDMLNGTVPRYTRYALPVRWTHDAFGSRASIVCESNGRIKLNLKSQCCMFRIARFISASVN